MRKNKIVSWGAMFLTGFLLLETNAQEKVFETVFRTDNAGNPINEISPDHPGKLLKEAVIADTILGKALSLPGDIYSYATFPETPGMAVGDEFTVSMWVWFESLPEESAPKNKQAYGFFSRGWDWRAELGRTGIISTQFTNKDKNGAIKYFGTKASLQSPSAQTWHHLAVTYSVRNQMLSLYWDGELKAARDKDIYGKTPLLKLDAGHAALTLGALPYYFPLKGKIARTRIYAQALGPLEIQKEEQDFMKKILSSFQKELSALSGNNAMELAQKVDALLNQPSIELAELGRIPSKIAALKKDSRFDGKELYYSIVNPMGQETFLPDSMLPEEQIGKPLLIAAAKEEFEPASFLVRPLKDIPDFTPLLDEFKTASGKTLPASIMDIRVVKVLAQSGGGATNRHIRVLKPAILLHDDALVKVDPEKMENHLRLSFPSGAKYQWISKQENSHLFERFLSAVDNPVFDAKTIQPMQLKKNQNQQYWLTVRVPADAQPGLYRSNLKLTSGNKLLATIPVKLRVLPFALPAPRPNYDLDRPFFTGVYYRHFAHELFQKDAPGSLTSRGRNLQQFRAELKNMREHGISYPTVVMAFNFPSWRWNQWGTDAAGGTIFEPTAQDRAYFKKTMEILKEEGMSLKPLFIQNGNFGFAQFYNPEKHRAILKKLVDETLSIVKETLGHTDVEFYGNDEATGPRLTGQYPVWEDMRKMGAKVFTTATRTNVDKIAGRISTLISSGVPDSFYAEQMHKSGGTIWNYANPQAGTKEQPFPYRVNYGFGVYAANYDGIATYGYNISAAHPWNDFDNRVEPDLAFVIGTADGVADTPSWEGYREGIDDIRYATKLRQEIRKAESGSDLRKKQIAVQAGLWLSKINVHAPGFDPEWTRFQIIEWILKLI